MPYAGNVESDLKKFLKLIERSELRKSNAGKKGPNRVQPYADSDHPGRKGDCKGDDKSAHIESRAERKKSMQDIPYAKSTDPT